MFVFEPCLKTGNSHQSCCKTRNKQKLNFECFGRFFFSVNNTLLILIAKASSVVRQEHGGRHVSPEGHRKHNSLFSEVILGEDSFSRHNVTCFLICTDKNRAVLCSLDHATSTKLRGVLYKKALGEN